MATTSQVVKAVHDTKCLIDRFAKEGMTNREVASVLIQGALALLQHDGLTDEQIAESLSDSLQVAEKSRR